ARRSQARRALLHRPGRECLEYSPRGRGGAPIELSVARKGTRSWNPPAQIRRAGGVHVRCQQVSVLGEAAIEADTRSVGECVAGPQFDGAALVVGVLRPAKAGLQLQSLEMIVEDVV